jgi:hypothetical protein
MSALTTLDLRFCTGVEFFLRRCLERRCPSALETLRIEADISLSLAQELLGWLRGTGLKEIVIRLGGASAVLELQALKPFVRSLELLVLDLRQDNYNPTTRPVCVVMAFCRECATSSGSRARGTPSPSTSKQTARGNPRILIQDFPLEVPHHTI